MGQADYFLLGANNVICDRCGFKYKSTQVRKEWTGLIVCKKCWDPRHPQDKVRAVKDDQSPSVNRPEATDTFLSPGDVTADDL